ncbi:MAG TPA: hypothetical protein VIZ22_11180 [Candidatus Limnocylindrales bacterium]
MSGTSRRRRALGIGIALLLVVCAFGIPGAATAYTDSDKDGLPNKFERQKSHTNPHRKDTDRDGTKDGNEDPDRDGLSNRYEFLAGTNPRKKDTDKDGKKDGAEDPDKDGLTNVREQAAHTHPRKADTDGDGTRDDREDPDHDGLWNIIEFRADTKPRDADSDNDGRRDGNEGTRDDALSNGVEQGVGTNPGLKDTDGDGKPDGREDPDADGLMTIEEVVRGLDPKDADSDNDGTLDGDETVAVVDAPVIQGAPDCTVFPADNVWNAKVDALDVASNSSTMISTIGSGRSFHMDFGSYAGYGIPYQVVDGSATKRNVVFDYDDESDAGPYPIPAFPLIEDGSDAHMLLVDRDDCKLYELFAARQSSSGTWHAGSGAIWDMDTNALRPDGWTSADAAGLPILPGLVRWDEVASGEITHALRFTAPQTRNQYIYPARHEAGSAGASLPPMGMRVRLKDNASVNNMIAGLSDDARVIAIALQRYGMILADNGSAWYISGASDPRFDDDVMHELDVFEGSNLEVVDTSGLVNGP